MSRIVIGALPWDTMVVVVMVVVGVVVMVVKRTQKSYRNFPFMIIERDKNTTIQLPSSVPCK